MFKEQGPITKPDDTLFEETRLAIAELASMPHVDCEALGQYRREAARWMTKIVTPGHERDHHLPVWEGRLRSVRDRVVLYVNDLHREIPDAVDAWFGIYLDRLGWWMR
jgi:hypothetical protein